MQIYMYVETILSITCNRSFRKLDGIRFRRVQIDKSDSVQEIEAQRKNVDETVQLHSLRDFARLLRMYVPSAGHEEMHVFQFRTAHM